MNTILNKDLFTNGGFTFKSLSEKNDELKWILRFYILINDIIIWNCKVEI